MTLSDEEKAIEARWEVLFESCQDVLDKLAQEALDDLPSPQAILKHAVFEWDGEWWIASTPDLPGAFSQGRTIPEARYNLLDAACELLFAQFDLAGKSEDT